MARKSLIKGKGADIFLEGETPEPPSKKKSTRKLTVYIPEELWERLDAEWLAQRSTNKNAQKSLIVTEALERLFSRQDDKTAKQ
jgi:hypothetical protein